MNPSRNTKVVVVTGLSGAGKTTAIEALEDRGYHAIENLPPATTENAIVACEQAGVTEIALGLSSTVRSFLDGASFAIKSLSRDGLRDVRVLFLDASDEMLVRRFSETRRPHPIEAEAHRAHAPHLSSVLEGIELERLRMSSLRSLADVVIDTSKLNVHELKRRVITLTSVEPARMSTRLMSFGFKLGVPADADLVFDVRFLKNPYFVPELRDLTGHDAGVAEYVAQDEGFEPFMTHLTQLVTFLLPRYQAEGKSYLTVAIGCTGGQHRSVASVLELHRRLSLTQEGPFFISHRDATKKARLSGEFPRVTIGEPGGTQ